MRKLLLAALLASVAALPAKAIDILTDGVQFNGHAVTTNAVGNPPPTTTSCTLVAGSSDLAGQCAATAAAGVAVAFGKPFATAPTCIVFDGTTFSGNALAAPVSTTGFTMGTTVAADVIKWICLGKQGN